MKKILKRMLVVVMIATMAVGSVLVVPPNEASAASTIKQVTLYNWTNAIGSISTSEDNYYVNVSIEAGYTWLRQKWDWVMELQRYENGAWRTIGTRTGYVAYQDASHRTFSNIAVKGAQMRVKITFQPYYYAYFTDGSEGWVYDRGPFVHYSNTWRR